MNRIIFGIPLVNWGQALLMYTMPVFWWCCFRFLPLLWIGRNKFDHEGREW